MEGFHISSRSGVVYLKGLILNGEYVYGYKLICGGRIVEPFTLDVFYGGRLIPTTNYFQDLTKPTTKELEMLAMLDENLYNQVMVLI